MQVRIYCDMEGVAGIQSWDYTGGNGARYEEGRKLYTGEVCAAVRGCKKANVEEIVAIDGHGGAPAGGRSFMNWINEQLEPGARYVQGYPWARYVEGLDGCEAAILLAAHSRAGTEDGVLSHTVNADGWYEALVNGKPVGEIGITAAVLGSFGVPVILVTGDTQACAEAKEWIGESVRTAAVKVGLGRYAASNLAPADARHLIEEEAMHAVYHRDAWPKPLTFEAPVQFQVEYATPDRAAAYAGRPDVEIVGQRTVRATGNTFWEAFSAVMR